jgi:hypothetical protein
MALTPHTEFCMHFLRVVGDLAHAHSQALKVGQAFLGVLGSAAHRESVE